MAGHDTKTLSSITRAFGSVTSIFRCHGLNYVPANADSIGGHDLLYWSAFLALLSAWFLFFYSPQCRRFEKLTGRQQALILQLSQDKKALARLDQAIGNLKNGDPLAWERAARARMGWLEPGEILDAGKSNPNRLASGNIPQPAVTQPRRALTPLPRPRVPLIPRPPTMLTQGLSTRPQFADSGTLGPTTARPPAPPPAPAIPRLPPRPNLRAAPPRPPVTQPASYNRTVRR